MNSNLRKYPDHQTASMRHLTISLQVLSRSGTGGIYVSNQNR